MSKSRFASLTSGLLARKGEAEPVATPFADQILTRVGAPAQEVMLSPMRKHLGPVVATHGGTGGLEVAFGQRKAAPVIPPDVPSFFTDPPDDEYPPPPTLNRYQADFIHRVAVPTPTSPDLPGFFLDPNDDETFHRTADVVPMPRLRPARAVPMEPPVELADACGNCPSPADAGKVYHVNLRLKRSRFVRLKLTAALTRRPVQEIVSEALDAWFAQMPDDIKGGCACLAGKEN